MKIRYLKKTTFSHASAALIDELINYRPGDIVKYSGHLPFSYESVVLQYQEDGVWYDVPTVIDEPVELTNAA